MSKPFDAATKRLLESQPADWLIYLDLAGDQAELMETDLTTVTSEADRVVRVRAPTPYLAHIEFQSTYEADMDERVLRYNVLLYCRYRIPTQSVVVLLRRQADGPELTGAAGYQMPQTDGSLAFRYRIVRVWEKSVEQVLAGGLATLPLAPLANVSEGELPAVIQRMEARMAREAPSADVGMLWTATYLLMGLRYEREVIQQLLKGVRSMKESVTYQEILEEGAAIGEARGEAIGEARGEARGEAIGEARGKIEEARNLVLRLGSKRYGPPDAETETALASIGSLERLEQLAERLLEAESWKELLHEG